LIYNMNMEIRVERAFHAAHRIWQHKERCRFLHGHSYRVRIRAEGGLDRWGMVADFSDVKAIVDQLDHCVILSKEDPLADVLKREGQRLFLLDRNPTAENLALLIAQRLIEELSLERAEVEVFETENQSALCLLSRENLPGISFERT